MKNPKSSTTALSKAVWLDRFGRHLLKLVPTLTAVEAAARSVDAYREQQDVWPEKAAERMARVLNGHSGSIPS
jgi:hypothetical protein